MAHQSARTLPSRRPQISREFLDDHRRRRYVDAVAELVHEFGRYQLSITNIVRLAGTARNSFYDVFASAEDCIAYGIDLAVGELFSALAAQDGEGEWLVEVHEAIAGFYDAVADEPLLAELFLLHSTASRVGHGEAWSRAGGEPFAEILRRGRPEAEARGRSLPASAEQFFSQAIVAPAARRVRRPEVEALPGEASAITALVGRFYLGHDASPEPSG